MVNEEMYALGAAPNKIREIFAYGLERKAQIGDDKVFDLSIGNPSVPSPEKLDETLVRLVEEGRGKNHEYTMSPGLTEAREAIAQDLNARFGTDYTAGNLYLTAGASAAIAIAIKAVVLPGEELIAITPYFPEYKTWASNAGAVTVEVPARSDDFMLDVDAIEAAVTEKTAAVIINTPNNPVGSVYSDENLQALADVLRKKSEEFGHTIYLISDEPYRELVYDGLKPAWVPSLYDATFVCYSWSKSFSLPGERIGYLLVPNSMPDFDRVYKAVCGAGRSLGFICDSVLFQRAVAESLDAPIDIEPYDTNRKILYDGLTSIGYNVVKPQGAFYMWIEALEPDAEAFCEVCKEHELLLVPSNGFLTQGWTRVGYCCSEDTIRGALAAFKEVYDEYAARS